MTDYTELERLEAAATEGPWQTNAVPSLGSTANGVFTKPADPDAPEIFVCSVKPRWDQGCAVGDEAIANAEFIAAIRNAAPALIAKARAYDALLAEAEKLRAKHENAEALLKEFVDASHKAYEKIKSANGVDLRNFNGPGAQLVARAEAALLEK